MCGWCLTHVGRDTSSMSPGWSLLPSKVIIVLALVNSTVSPVGTQVSQRDLGVPLYSLLVPLPQDCCAFWLVPMCIMLGSDTELSVWPLLCTHHIQCMTYIPCNLLANTHMHLITSNASNYLTCTMQFNVNIAQGKLTISCKIICQ